jgi:ATP-dependent helicase/nuclease subunit A
MSGLADQLDRDRFTSGHGKNISVIAPAGVGKTHAIVERIVALASLPEALAVDRLARLIVVTYSVRAAQEMQQRARSAIRRQGLPSHVQRAFQQTFFGTIHSYCVRLLERFGHYLGLPSPIALLQSHDEWWNRFLVRGLQQEIADERPLRELFHFFAPEKLYALGREISPGHDVEISSSPQLDLRALLAFSANGMHPSTKRSLVSAQANVRRWSEAWGRGDRFHPLPKCPETQKAPEFIELWSASFEPLHAWLRAAALAFGRRVANAYEAFRLSEAVMTYDDQVRIALRLLQQPAVQRELAEERLSVLLDEAQDTDPRQFEVLLRVAGLRLDEQQAEDQSFCIVGDFQQAIYAPRSDLSVYQRVHDEIIVEPRGSSSKLQVTFRCDAAIIHFVNRIFPDVLHGNEGQSEFFPLIPHQTAGSGQVVRWLCPDEPQHQAGIKIKAEVRAHHEARFLAEKLRSLNPPALGARDWSQVAILCPRRNWLHQISAELTAVGLPVQLHSSDETQNDRTPGAWLTALVWVMAHPEDTFEIAGVLREVFGVSDDAMATFTQTQGDRLRLDRLLLSASGEVHEALQILRECFTAADTLPLHQALQRLLEKTQLRERLRSLSEEGLENAEKDLDDFLGGVYQRCAEGATLPELAEELRVGLTQAYPAQEEIRDAIQLLTSHKAKGLEWQVVIIPYLFRTIETKSPAYPRLVYAQGGTEMIFRDKIDYAAHAKTFVTERDRQQLQRLLYVMCTRARNTLLLIDDESLFDGQLRRGGWSSGELLKFLGGVGRVTWQALPENLAPVPRETVSPAALQVEMEFPETLSKRDFTRARARALDIPKRITPHALAIHPQPESEPEAQMDQESAPPSSTRGSPGILYGTWWHEFVQRIPWQKSPATWQHRFDEAVLHSPQPERSQHEWTLFYQSSLARWLAEPGRIIHRELPFLWPETEQTCLEGIMDLAVYTPGAGDWHVIDWKTNRLGPEGSAACVATYSDQINAYVRALRQMLSADVKGSLYLTATGEWIPIG